MTDAKAHGAATHGAASPAPAAPAAVGRPQWFAAGSTADKVTRVLLWEGSPALSAVALCIGLAFAFLVEVGGYSGVTLLCYIVLLQLTVCFAYVNALTLWLRFSAGAKVVTAPAATAADRYVTADFLHAHLQTLADALNPWVVFAVNACRCRRNLTTVKAVLLLLVASQLARACSTAVLFGIAWLVLFTAPKLYLSNKALVDKQWAAVAAQLAAVEAKLPAAWRDPAPAAHAAHAEAAPAGGAKAGANSAAPAVERVPTMGSAATSLAAAAIASVAQPQGAAAKKRH